MNAYDTAEHYLAFKLGARRGCKVLDYIEDEEIQREIIQELAKVLEDYAKRSNQTQPPIQQVPP
jgi:hypothetical protein